MADQGDSERPKVSDLAPLHFDDEAIKAEIGFRLRQAVKLGGGNKVVAAKSGIPLKTLGNLLKGQTPNMMQAVRLSLACRVSLDWLGTGRLPVHPLEETADLVATDEAGAGSVATTNYDALVEAALAEALDLVEVAEEKEQKALKPKKKAQAAATLYYMILDGQLSDKAKASEIALRILHLAS